MDRVLNTSTPVRKLVPPDTGKFVPAKAQRYSVPVQPARAPNPAFSTIPQASSSAQRIGLFCLCGYLCAGYANDLSIRLFGGKAYLSWLFGIGLAVAVLGSGSAFRALQTNIGKCWAGVTVLLLFSGAFSLSRGESIGVLTAYIPKNLFVFFYCCTLSLTLRNCRTLMTGNIVCATAILLNAALFGATGEDGGRFSIPNSLFLGNSNDLALVLVCNLGFSLYLIWQKSTSAIILGSLEFLVSVYFLLKTASRGGFLAFAACMIVWLIFATRRGRLAALAVPAVCIAMLLPGSILSRLIEIAAPGALSADSAMDGNQMSQYERTQLLETSIRIAVTHPLFGTGPGTFMDALWNDDVSHGTHTAALGTHNTYTQLASECGFPVLILYLGALFGSIRANYRMMKRTRGAPRAEGVFTVSICLFGSLIAFAVGSAFDHVAYGWTLPILSGITVALYLASHGGDPQWIEAEVAAGNA